MALFESARGNFIPFFMTEFEINNSVMSIVVAMNTVGCVFGSYLAGWLCEKLGHKFVFIAGTAIASAAILTAPYLSSVYMLGAFYLFFGLGRSFLSISIDSLVPVLSVGFEVILMNVTHFMYGFGSFAGQSSSGAMLSAGFTWRGIYLIIGLMFAAAFLFTLFMKLPKMQVVGDKDAASRRRDLFRHPLIYVFIIALAFQTLNEAMLGTWFVNYMRSTYSFDPSQAAVYASAYFLFFTVGRLLGGYIVFKLGSTRGLKVFMLLGAVVVTLGLILKQNGLMLLSSSGFFIGVGFPTLMVVIGRTFSLNASFAIGLSTTFGNLLFIALQSMVGMLNDLIGTYAAFFITPISLLGCMAAVAFISKMSPDKVEQ